MNRKEKGNLIYGSTNSGFSKNSTIICSRTGAVILWGKLCQTFFSHTGEGAPGNISQPKKIMLPNTPLKFYSGRRFLIW
jgi:hypothetical protein